MIEVDATQPLGGFRLDARFAAGGGLIALFGRSGAGKTSLVNVIAGLTRPQRGRVVVNGRVLLDTERGLFVPRHRRRIGYVFQDGRLFPHLSVRQNLAYGGWFVPRGERYVGFDRVVGLLGLEPLLTRRPGSLSGGEKQRVALGRALLASPRLLLMDEPLAALDAARKAEILPYIERLRDDLALPIVYVSHAVEEVMRLASTVVLLSEGRVAAVGPPAAVMSRLDLGPAGGAEAGSILEARVARHEPRFALTVLDHPAGEIRLPGMELPVGSLVRMRVRARDVAIALERPRAISIRNVLAGRIAEIAASEEPMVDIRLDLAGSPLLARLTREAVHALDLAPGRAVFALVKSIAFDRRALGYRADPARGRPGAGEPDEG